MKQISKPINLYSKLLNSLIKKGNKSKARKILNTAFFLITKKLQKPIIVVLYQLFFNLNVFVEARTVRYRRSSHVVPFGIKHSRRTFLIIKWLLKGVAVNAKKLPLAAKLCEEIILILEKGPSAALKFRKINNSLAQVNRSNAHFRW